MSINNFGFWLLYFITYFQNFHLTLQPYINIHKNHQQSNRIYIQKQPILEPITEIKYKYTCSHRQNLYSNKQNRKQWQKYNTIKYSSGETIGCRDFLVYMEMACNLIQGAFTVTLTSYLLLSLLYSWTIELCLPSKIMNYCDTE